MRYNFLLRKMGQANSSVNKTIDRSNLRTFIKENCKVIASGISPEVIISQKVSGIDTFKVKPESDQNDFISNCQLQTHVKIPNTILTPMEVSTPVANTYKSPSSIADCHFLLMMQGQVSSGRVNIWSERLRARFAISRSHITTCVPNWDQVMRSSIRDLDRVHKHICVVVDPEVSPVNVRKFLCSNQGDPKQAHVEGVGGDALNRRLSKKIKRSRSVCLESDAEKCRILKLVRALESELGVVSFHSPELFTCHLLSPSTIVTTLDPTIHRVKYQIVTDTTSQGEIVDHQANQLQVQTSATSVVHRRCNKDWFYSQSGHAPRSKRKRVIEPSDQSPVKCYSPERTASVSPKRINLASPPVSLGSDDGGSDTGRGVNNPHLRPQSFACQHNQPKTNDLNNDITAALIQIAESIHNSKTPNSEFRARSYKNLALRVARFPRRLACAEELNEVAPKLSAKMLFRINEAISGMHPLLQDGSTTDRQGSAVSELQGIWGVGQAIAMKWASKGVDGVHHLRQLLATNSPKLASLSISRRQRIGLKRYEDLLDRMSRAEAQTIGDRVRAAVDQLLPGCEVIQCGSFRRGKTMCGDVDILIAPPVGFASLKECEHLLTTSQQSLELEDQTGMMEDQELSLFLSLLLNTLSGFITDILQVSSSNDCDSFMGVCKLDDTKLHRRLDIKCYPRKALPFAVLYFTGSAHFNRSMRLWAKKQGWKLLDTCLEHRTGRVTSSDVHLHKQINSITTEKDIFRFLGLEYRSPIERDVSNVCLSAAQDMRPSGAYRAQKRM